MSRLEPSRRQCEHYKRPYFFGAGVRRANFQQSDVLHETFFFDLSCQTDLQNLHPDTFDEADVDREQTTQRG